VLGLIKIRDKIVDFSFFLHFNKVEELKGGGAA